MKVKQLENNNGFAASDALIAILILTLSASIIATLIYNIYLSNTSLKRMSKANGYIIDVFEYIDKTYYDDVNKESLTRYFNNKYYYQEDGATSKEDAEAMVGDDVTTPFKVKIDVQNYNEIQGNEDKLDLVKEITMSVTYKLGGKDQIVEIKRIKSRETLVTPNKPELSLITLVEGERIYPIKEMNGNYVVCNSNDSNWYNYEENKPAQVVVTTTELAIGDTVNSTDDNIKIYKWTPRYAENSEGDIKYLYSNTNKYVGEQEGYQKLISLEDDYFVDEKFNANNSSGIWELISSDI